MESNLRDKASLLIKNYILQLFTNRLFFQSDLLFNYRILSETIQARIIQMSLDFMCTLSQLCWDFFCLNIFIPLMFHMSNKFIVFILAIYALKSRLFQK